VLHIRHRLVNDAKEPQQLLLINCRLVADSLAKIANQLRPITINMLRPLPRSNLASELQTQNIGPLLERLIGTLRPDKPVVQAVRDLHPRPAAIVTRVGVAHKVAPFLGGLLKTLSTGLVGAERSSSGSTYKGAG